MSEESRVSLREDKGEDTRQPVVPTDAVPLPSKGIVYPQQSPLHMAEIVEIRSMTAHDEDILTSRALLKQGKAISTLLRSCLVNKLIDPDDMLVGDRNAVLIAIRVTGYGADYEAEVVCPRCDENSKHVFDLSRLEIKPLSAAPVEPGRNEFEFELPKTKRKIRFKLQTGGDDSSGDTTGWDPSDSGGSLPPGFGPIGEERQSCACRHHDGAPVPPAALALLALVGVARRRRPDRTP